MRLSKFLTFLFIFTNVGLFYTHQQFSIVRANYSIIKYENELLQLLDRNQKLMYNVTTLESPANLEMKLKVNGVDFDVPRRWAVVKEEKSKPVGNAKVAERRNVVLERILNFITTKAEARVFEH